jgi:triosephosphate isomerase
MRGGIDGLFVGRAAWHVEGFARLIRSCAATLR